MATASRELLPLFFLSGISRGKQSSLRLGLGPDSATAPTGVARRGEWTTHLQHALISSLSSFSLDASKGSLLRFKHCLGRPRFDLYSNSALDSPHSGFGSWLRRRIPRRPGTSTLSHGLGFLPCSASASVCSGRLQPPSTLGLGALRWPPARLRGRPPASASAFRVGLPLSLGALRRPPAWPRHWPPTSASMLASVSLSRLGLRVGLLTSRRPSTWQKKANSFILFRHLFSLPPPCFINALSFSFPLRLIESQWCRRRMEIGRGVEGWCLERILAISYDGYDVKLQISEWEAREMISWLEPKVARARLHVIKVDSEGVPENTSMLRTPSNPPQQPQLRVSHTQFSISGG